MDKCIHCPVAPGSPCLAGVFCEWAAGGDPVHLRHILAVSARDEGRPLPVNPEAMPCNEAPVAPQIPLAGDLVESMTRRIGADRLAKWLAAKLGVDCGCEARRIAINKLDAKIRAYLSGQIKARKNP